MVNAIKMNKGQERFQKESLINEKVIGSEKVKIEKGCKLILCSVYKKEQEDYFKEEYSYVADGSHMYAVEKTHKGEYDTMPLYFISKKGALSYFNECCKTLKQENATQKQNKKNDDIKESSSLHINGLDLVGKAFISHLPAELADLAEYNNILIRKAVANNPFTSKDTLTYLRQYADYEMEIMIINNPNVEIDCLEQIISENSHIDKVLVAKANIVRRNLFMDWSRVFDLN